MTTAHVGDCQTGCETCTTNYHEGKTVCDTCGLRVDDAISYGELAELTHESQVAQFGFCTCEDLGNNPAPYDDCPNQSVKCASEDCDNWLNDDTDMMWSDDTGAYCLGCFEHDMEYASTLVRVWYGDEPITQRVTIGDIFIVGQYDMEEPEWMSDLHDGAWKGRVYVRTDAWRGHYDTEKSLDKCTVLTTGWTTGWADDTTSRKVDFNRFIEDCMTGDLVAPCAFYVLTEPTSNLFSTSVVVLVQTADLEVMTQWLDEVGHSIDTLESQLG